MTEDDAKEAVAALVPRGTMRRYEIFVALISETAREQNLVSPLTLPTLWDRHLFDSVQLVELVPDGDGIWLDIGTGAGFPGLIVAAALDRPVTLVEPRRLRAAFLAHAVERMDLRNVTVLQRNIQTLVSPACAVVSARAVAPLAKLFGMARGVADKNTAWLLMKGRSAADELADAREMWHGRFELMPSRTDDRAAIVRAIDVRPRERA